MKNLINSSKEKIWQALTDFEEYPNWNPFIQSIIGTLNVGEKLEVKIVPPKSEAMIFKPTILEIKKNTKYSWLGHILFR
jgi:hypothetical protein